MKYKLRPDLGPLIIWFFGPLPLIGLTLYSARDDLSPTFALPLALAAFFLYRSARVTFDSHVSIEPANLIAKVGYRTVQVPWETITGAYMTKQGRIVITWLGTPTGLARLGGSSERKMALGLQAKRPEALFNEIRSRVPIATEPAQTSWEATLQFRPAPTSQRVKAHVFDLLFAVFMQFGIICAISLVTVSVAPDSAVPHTMGQAVGGFGLPVIWWFNQVVPASFAASCGRLWRGLQVVDVSTGQKAGMGKLALRTTAQMAGLMFLLLPLWIMLITNSRRPYWDRLAGTMVVQVSRMDSAPVVGKRLPGDLATS